jgi:putative flippase GtrA
MRLLRLVPDKWQKLIHEALKFGTVGGVNLVINYAVFNALALTIFRNGQLKATVVAMIVSTISAYFMNRHWTYNDRPKSAMHRETALFVLVNAVGLLIELGILGLAKYGFDIHGLLALNVAKTFGLGLATVFRFWAYRTLVFRKAPAAEPGAVAVSVPSQHQLDAEALASFDPVAELAEVVSEYEASRAGSAPPRR